jgi:phytol kinase
MGNLFGLLIAYIYVFGVIGLAEILRRSRGYTSDFTRKVVHIGVGMLIWLVPLLFGSPWPFVLACMSFVVLNLLDYHFGFFAAMISSDRSNLGTVYFPLAAAAVSLIFWRQPPLMVAALMPLTWGDGLAPVVGRLSGKHQYQVMGYTRSLEGSLAFFLASVLFTWLALWLVNGVPDIEPLTAIAPALVVSFATAGIEAITIWGIDNLTIPAIAVLILQTWPF